MQILASRLDVGRGEHGLVQTQLPPHDFSEHDWQIVMATQGPSSLPTAKPRIGIVSVGEMGLGIAKLLCAHEYQVFTTSAGRRQVSLLSLWTVADTYKS